MHGHHLWGRPFGTPEEAIGWFGAMQAQEFVPAKWALGQRTSVSIDGTVDDLYRSGVILRTHVVRPTWHFVHRDDLRWLLVATKARVHQVNGTYYRKFGVGGDDFAKCVRALTKALKGGNEMNRRELTDLLAKDAGISASGLHLGYILMRAELESVIVSGTVGGKAPTYAFFDDRVPGDEEVEPEAALAELTKRYFTSRGPATLKDFVRWSSLTVAEAKEGLALIGSSLTQEGPYYFSKTFAMPAPRSPRIDLVQGYDEYVMSYSESKHLLRSAEPSRPIDLNAYVHAILLDGKVIGHWRMVRKPFAVDSSLYRSFSEAETAAMDEAVNRLSDYFGEAASWRVSSPIS